MKAQIPTPNRSDRPRLSWRRGKLCARVALSGLFAASAISHATSATAQTAFDWQGSASATIGVTTNVANTPVPAEDAPAGTPAPQWDGYGALTPGLALSVETARTIQTLSYVFDYRYYFVQHEANAYANNLAYQINIAASDTTNLSFGLTGSQAEASLFNVGGTAAGATLLTPGQNNVFSLGFNQAVTTDLTANDHFGQGLVVIASNNAIPEADDTQTYVGSATLQLNHDFERDVLGGQLGTDVSVYSEQRALDQITPSHTDIIHRGLATWRHDFSPEWFSNLGGGLMVAYRVDDEFGLAVQPIGNAGLNYASDFGSAGLTLTHAAQPNLLTQQTNLQDTVALNGGIPVGKGFDLSAVATGLAARELILSGGGFGPVTYSLIGEAAVGYLLPTVPLRFELRYYIVRQFGFSEDADGNALIPDVRRQNAQFTITYFFPDAPLVGGLNPSFVAVPAPASNPDVLVRQQSTAGSMQDTEQSERDEKKDDKERRESRDEE